MRLRNDYYVPGKHHLCLFCETPIAKLKDGRLLPLGNKAHVVMNKRHSPGLYIINCCSDCAKREDFGSVRLRAAIHRALCECRLRINPDAKLNLLDAPRGGFVRVETSALDRNRTLKAYKEMVKNAR